MVYRKDSLNENEGCIVDIAMSLAQFDFLVSTEAGQNQLWRKDSSNIKTMPINEGTSIEEAITTEQQLLNCSGKKADIIIMAAEKLYRLPVEENVFKKSLLESCQIL